MMQFNSPKNFKRGRLISNRYRPIDLVIAAVLITITLMSEMIYLLAMNGKSVVLLLLLCFPAMIGVCLLIPIEIYHNPIEMIKLYFIYRRTPKKWIWEGHYKRDYLSEGSDV